MELEERRQHKRMDRQHGGAWVYWVYSRRRKHSRTLYAASHKCSRDGSVGGQTPAGSTHLRGASEKALRELEAEELERSEPDNTDVGNSISLLVGLVADLRIQRLDNLRQNVQQAFEQTAASTGPIREDASSLTTISLPMPVADADVNIESLPLVRGGHELGERSDARSRTPTLRRPTTSRTITMEAALNDSNPALPHS
jgi:hypothetical protein